MQSAPSLLSMMIRRFGARLGACCARSGWIFSYFLQLLNFSNPPDGPACLVLDVRLPGQIGLDLQRELAATNIQIPIIFITGHADIPMSVQALKGGAIDFLTKPLREQDFLEAIQLGLARVRARRENEMSLRTLRERFEGFSPREREIMIQVVQGRLSKQIAFDIGISGTTVKVHRSHLMWKMKVGSLPELGRMADKLKLVAEGPQAAKPASGAP
jgi:FixJ family two-component response regulator